MHSNAVTHIYEKLRYNMYELKCTMVLHIFPIVSVMP